MKKAYRWIILICIPIFLCGIGVLWFLNQLNSVKQAPVSQFVITRGQSTADIVNHMQVAQLIQNTYVPLLYIRLHPMTFLPGTYAIPNQYKVIQLLELFTKEQRNEKKLTIPEGYTRRQIAELLPERGLSAEDFLKITTKDEGTLFPDTYSIDDNTTEIALRERMVELFEKKTSDLTLAANDIILASIVEREAKTDEERPLIAGIYKNRLKIGMALEADPTVQYGKYTDLGKAPTKDGKKNYWAPITKADYQAVDSLFNTYRIKGLPPAPICNPGLKSIEAAIHSTQTDAIFFFHTSEGRIITSRTLDEHNTNKAKYLK